MSDLLKRIDSLSPQQKKLLRKLAAEKRQAAKSIDSKIVARSGDLMLSYQQKALWVYKSLNPDSVAYNEAFMVRIEGRLNTDALSQSIDCLHARHETLRTRITFEDGQPVPTVDEQVSVDLECDDFSDLGVEKQKVKELELASSFRRRPFDLEKDLPYRFCLVKLGPEKRTLIVANHHIASDDWSKNVFVKELIEGYEAFSKGEQPEFASLPIQYSDYASWQHKRMQSGLLDAKMDLWKEAWQDGAPAVEMPTDYPRRADSSQEGGRLPLRIDRQTAEAMRKMARDNQTTVFNVALANYYVLLHRYTSQTELVAGVPFANRPRPELRGVIGFFVNPVAIPVQVDPDVGFRDFLRIVHERSRRALAAQEVPFDRVVEAFEHDRSADRAPLIQSMFSMNSAQREDFSIDGLSLQIEDLHDGNTAYDFSVSLTECEDGFAGHIEYKKALYNESTIGRMRDHFLTLLNSVLNDSDRSIRDLEMLPIAERHQILNTFNETQRDYPRERCLHELFEERAGWNPDAVALVFGEESLSYGELNARSNRLARRLQELGVGPDALVGICCERSLEMVVGLLGILKSGGAYVPLDPSYPTERLNFMLEDSSPVALLTLGSLPKGLEAEELPIVDLSDPLDGRDASNLDRSETGLDSGSLAYMIYTSGSTGKPKGVLVEHRSVVNFIHMECDAFGNQTELSGVSLCPYSFDVSVWEIFSILSSGGKLHLLGSDEVGRLPEFVLELGINSLYIPPSLLGSFIDFFEGVEDGVSLKRLLIGVEPIEIGLIQRFQTIWPSATIINGYGPTEATICSTFHNCRELTDVGRIIPIGRPVSNCRIRILDSYGSLCPIGVPGELCVSGEQVARGYLNRPALTSERFVEDPFRPGERMYLTGDLARWSSGGDLEFLGRIDDQVKIRGFRIELGEIESRLLESDGVREVAVIALEEAGGEKSLVAYYVSGSEVGAEDLRTHLSRSLPEYMVPAAYVRLDALPLTPNGKLDRKSLPSPEGDAYARRGYEAPIGGIEKNIAAIWEEVLGVDKVGRHDDFFDLGGHSLKVVTAAGKIRQRLEVDLPLRRMFDSPTVEGLAAWVSANAESKGLGIVEVEPRDYYPASSQQRRLFALQELEPDSAVYNMPSAYWLGGDVDVEKVRRTIARLVERHEVLRTSFEIVGDNLVQRVHDDAAVDVEILDASGSEIDDFAGRFVKAFDLSSAPLLRAKILRNPDGRSVLFLDMHHIISDGLSTGVLIRDFARLYGGEPTPPIGLRYRDFAVWQQEGAGRNLIGKQADYWLKRFEERVPVLDLPTDFTRPQKQDYAGASFEATIDREATARLRRFCRESEATLYMTMLAGYSVLISRYGGVDDVVIGNAVSGREHSGFENTMGMFVNTLAMRCRPERDKRWSDYLTELRLDCLDAFENQQYPFEELVDRLDLERDMSRNPLFDTMLVVQNFDADLDSSEFRSIHPYDLPIETAKFDILVFVWESEDEIRIRMEYATQLYREETIRRFAIQLKQVLGAAIENPRARLSELSILDKGERNRIVNEFNNTEKTYPISGCLHEVFEERVKAHPDRIAIVEGGESLSYGELNERANHLARRLVNESSVAAEKIVGVLLDRSVDVVISILGILKAGGAYLPIDTAYPSERISFLLEDSAACALVTRAGSEIEFGGTMIDLDGTDHLNGYSVENLQRESDSSSLAYVIYTSGSTGKPKGVMVEHRSVANTLNFLEERYPLGEDDAYLFKTNYTFDVSVSEIFGWFWGGGRLAILPKGDEKDPYAIAAAVKKHAATHINFVPSMMNAFLSAIGDEERDLLDSLKYVLIAGEAFNEALYKKYVELGLEARLENIYGPTEASIYATCFSLSSYGKSGLVPIGKPLPNTKAYIVGKGDDLLPIGAVGELCLGGSGLARGYLNREELTREAFVENPLQPGERMYRTGDLARWLSDGNIEYLGRIDHQVKVRGFRIELGEIETSLLRYPRLRDAIVVAKELSGNAMLIAYYLSDETVERDNLKAHLGTCLPHYMIPSHFIELDAIPRTSSGKVDRKALPDPDAFVDSESVFIEPRNETDAKIVSIWREVLGVERIGIDDDFFKLGGHSLTAVSIVSRIAKDFGITLNLRDLFENATVRGLSDRLVQQQRHQNLIVDESEIDESFEMI